MDDSDYEYLVDLVIGLLAEYGLSELAAETNYVVDGSDDREASAHLMEPRDHLLALLEAFDTHLLLNDSSVANRSLATISSTCTNRGPEAAIVLGAARGDAPETTALLEYPDLSLVRKEVRLLCDRIREAPRGSPREME